MDKLSRRKFVIIGLFILAGLIFIIRLFDLQVLSPVYKQSATNNVLRKVIQYPSRGLIYDRNGELLVYDQAAYDLLVTPREVRKFDTLLLCNLLEITKKDLLDRLKDARDYSPYKPSIIVKQITPERYAVLQEQLHKFHGFYTQTRTLRDYPKKMASHVLGYIGEVSNEMIEKDPYYQMGDYAGISGIEYTYEKDLRGEKGVEYFLVDVHSRIKGSYREGRNDVAAKTGKNLICTIDSELQEYIELLMQNKRGAVVALEPSTGEVLAMVSSPGYDPNLLVGRPRGQNFQLLQSDSLQPLFNRAITAIYPPGSTFKMAQALIALQEGVITPETEFHCDYGYHIGNYTMACHHNQDFNLNGAISHSCNAYFSYVFKGILEKPEFGSVKNGYDIWREYITSFGFGRKLGTDFYNEQSGSVPTSEYYEDNVFKGTRWRVPTINSLAIGQGELEITPIQMANYAAVLANRGFYYIPHIIKNVGDRELDERFREKNYAIINEEHFEKVINGMEKVFEEGGTAYWTRINGITMCGKTGTAQNPHGKNHSVFVVFAPRENPKIAISAYVEFGGEGSSYAAPISSLIVEKYLTDTISYRRKWIEERMLDVVLLDPGTPD
ncbi:MAG: penicillin-binding protein 2 [Prolixibacteraceae bacterium]|nr:penicillin-binding protein 2 [Prolixibacteraceae bacterium]MBN2773822.1 penicillin-binding protein 2 [Prolixibacteraceae bacterium]